MFCCKISETSQFFAAGHVLEYEALAKGRSKFLFLVLCQDSVICVHLGQNLLLEFFDN